MAHTVIGRDVNFGLAGCCLRQHGVDRRRVWIAAHDRTSLGIDRFDLANTIIFFCRRRVLVLADAVGRIVFKRGNGRQTCLDTVAPSEPIDVVARLAVARQNTC
jgi:hypothetical protein